MSWQVWKVDDTVNWHDTGCRYYPACLSCPFPRCLLEAPGGAPAELRRQRDAVIRQQFARGVLATTLAAQYGLHRRSIYYIIGPVEPLARQRRSDRPPDGMKRCQACREVLPLDAFHRWQRPSRAPCKVCKRCDNARRRERYAQRVNAP